MATALERRLYSEQEAGDQTSRRFYDKVCFRISRDITGRYSTSFSMGTRLLSAEVRPNIYAIYGFVRLADEIVDSFHDQDKSSLLSQFRQETFEAIDRGFSLNPILQSFQQVVNRYGIALEFIEAFFTSMEMDLEPSLYDDHRYQEYIYGSAEVVGLMCLQVFCNGDPKLFSSLKAPARALGSAFQKVNFLRDMQADYYHLGRTYFPGVDFSKFNDADKRTIEEEIAAEFREALAGIRRLPDCCRLGVYAAYSYYWALFNKIRRAPAPRIQQERIRIPNSRKLLLTTSALLRYQLNQL
jgi:phytoene/squalene synthetase